MPSFAWYPYTSELAGDPSIDLYPVYSIYFIVHLTMHTTFVEYSQHKIILISEYSLLLEKYFQAVSKVFLWEYSLETFSKEYSRLISLFQRRLVLRYRSLIIISLWNIRSI